jgi:folate-binding protein YgfZ
MNTTWQTFLDAQGAAPGAPSDVPLESECALCALNELGIIRVSGAQASDFLQSQVSNDLRELTATHTQLSSHCNAKGRMLCNFRVLFDGDDGYRLILPRERLAVLLPRLRLFVLRAQVELADLSDEQVCFGLLGTCMPAMLEARLGQPLPEADNDLMQWEDSHLMRIAGPLPRWLFVGSPASGMALWKLAQSGAASMGSDFWALQDIRAGLPTITAATSEALVPQMANLQLIDGLSFHKGCYTGQEVVARMQYLGKLKRRMYVAEVALDTPPAPGTPLHSPGSRSEQGAGLVVDARRNAAGGCELLAVAEIAAVERGDVTLADSGAPLSLQPPPYGFPVEV